MVDGGTVGFVEVGVAVIVLGALVGDASPGFAEGVATCPTVFAEGDASAVAIMVVVALALGKGMMVCAGRATWDSCAGVSVA